MLVRFDVFCFVSFHCLYVKFVCLFVIYSLVCLFVRSCVVFCFLVCFVACVLLCFRSFWSVGKLTGFLVWLVG